MVRARSNSGRALLAALLAVLFGAACQADVVVDVEVAEDGSGLVTTRVVLDAEAAEGLADLEADATLLLNDLAVAGWEVDPPVTGADGETTVVATKAFGTAAQFAEVMDELTRDDGIFQDFRLTRQQAFGRVDYLVQGTIDPTGGFDTFGDEELTVALGRTVSAIAVSAPYEASPEDVTFRLTVELPGQFQEERSNGSIVTGPETTQGTWSTDLATPQQLQISLESSRRSTTAQVLRGVAVVAGVLAALVLFAQLLRVFGGRRRQLQEERARAARKSQAAARRRADTAAGSSPTDGPSADDEGRAAPAEATEARYRVVALDGPGVLYREGDDIRQLLVPFARERGSAASVEDITDKARLLSLGRMTSADFWRAIGVPGDPSELDGAYLARHQLNPGVVRYLRSLRDQQIRAACITNESAAWAVRLRASHSLDGLIDPWVVSGSVGVRKPDPPLFEVLRRVTGEAPSAILVVDDDLDNLDAARDLGFGTRWFSREGSRDDARGHEVMRSFEGFDPTETGEVVVGDRTDRAERVERAERSDSTERPEGSGEA